MIQDIKTVMHLLKKHPDFFYIVSMNLQISHMQIKIVHLVLRKQYELYSLNGNQHKSTANKTVRKEIKIVNGLSNHKYNNTTNYNPVILMIIPKLTSAKIILLTAILQY